MPRVVVFGVFLSVALTCFASTSSQPTSNPQAVAYAAQSIAAMTGGATVSDVTLTGNVTWTAGSDTEAGTASLKALSTGESRMDLALSNGTLTEIRDASTGTPLGKWINPGGTGMFAFHNCQTDAVWFFPVLGSLATGPNVVLSYVGLETRNGESVQHIQSFVYQTTALSSTLQQMSTLDFYLDATTMLPSAIAFSAHPDNNANANLSVEVDFSNYQTVSGVTVPMHIQKFLQGTLLIDITISTATFNSGLPTSDFTIN
jgi:hypothetical protein